MLPERLHRQVEFLDKNAEYSITGTNMILFDEYGQWGERKIVEKPDKLYFIKGNPFFHPTVMIRSKILKDLQGYKDNKITRSRLEDAELWFRLYSKGYIGYNIQEPLHQFREDRAAYNRRKFKYRFPAVLLRLHGYMILKLPLWCYIFALKPLVAGMIPDFIMMKYHRKKAIKYFKS
jgi:glycosyltransferase EpsE